MRTLTGLGVSLGASVVRTGGRARSSAANGSWSDATRPIPDPATTSTSTSAGERVLIVRARTGELRGAYDVCRHRGSRLVLEEPRGGRRGRAVGTVQGVDPCARTTPGRTAWTVSSASAPFLYRDATACDARSSGCTPWRSTPGAVSSSSNLTPTDPAVPLADAAGRRRSPDVRRYPLAELRNGAPDRYEVAANWKVDRRELQRVLPLRTGAPRALRGRARVQGRRGGRELDWGRGIPHREGATTFTLSRDDEPRPVPGPVRGGAHPTQG